MVRKPEVDQEKVKVQSFKETKVVLYHFSAVDDNMLEEYADLGLDYIWKTMHCSSIKVWLEYFMQDDKKNPGNQKLQRNEMLQGIFKKRVFRWKTLQNDMNGDRRELMES